MAKVEDSITEMEQLNNFVNGIAKRLLLLLLTYFVNNIVVNKIKNKHSFADYFVNVINKIRKPMILTLIHLSKYQGTTRRILEVEEMIPSSTAKWCLDWLLEWDITKYQESVKSYRGRNFKIYFLNGSPRDTVEIIEQKHIQMYHKLRKLGSRSKLLSEENEMFLFKCLDCKETKLLTYSNKICPNCGSNKLARISGGL